MSGDSGDSSSDHSEKPSCSRRITRRSKYAATTSSCSTSAAAASKGCGNKKKRRIVMRIEFDGDSDDTSSTSGSSNALSDVDDGDGCNRGGSSRNNKRKAELKRKQKNIFSDDEDDIKPCSTRLLRGELGKKINFTSNSDDINNNSSEDDKPDTSTRRNNRHQTSNRNRLRNRQRLEENNDDEHFEKKNASGERGGSINSREISNTVRSRKRFVLSGDDDDNINATSPTVQENNRDDENGFNSDSSSNELLEKCPICLLTFRAQEIGSPATCEHIFCANCIEAWSKNVQTCPIDRIEFDRIVVRDSYENREIVREINVSKSNGADKLNHELSDEDVTHCEVCNRPDREDVMLLCDSCNQGYHIDCLTPPLSDIPEGSWYCDNCFDSENSDDSDMVDDLNVLYEDIRDMGIPESRLRVTEVHQPRILRTRQNERIRAAILSRTRSSVRSQAVRANAESTSSRAASSSRSNREVRNSSRSTRTTKSRRRRKRRVRQRTYVVEYDLNNFDEKFAIKTTKRVIRRRRRRRTRAPIPRCRQMENTGERMTASKRLAEQLGVKSTHREMRAAASSQSFSLFGNANDLEYFSDSDGGLQSEIQIETGGSGSTAVQTSVRISNFRTHRSKNGLLSRLEREQPSSTPDLLSNIMELQDRWHNASRHLDSVRIGQDGSLNLPPSSELITNPIENTSIAKPNTTNTVPTSGVNQSDVTEAPMYPRGGGGGNNRNFNSGGGGGSSNSGGGGNYNNRYNNQSNYRGSSSGGGGSGGGGQFRSSFGSSTTSSNGNLFNMVGRGNFSFSSQTFNQNNDNDNNGANNNTNNRDRFNQRNNNNRNNRNSLPLFNNSQSNENLSSLSSQQQSSIQQPLQQSLPSPRPLLSIPTVQPPSQFPITAHQQHQSTTSTIPSLTSMPLPPPIGLYSSLPPTSAPPPLFRPPPILSQPPPIIPMRPPPPVIPPLAAPPAFNSSLFQLTADYGNDDDDDSNCPNFSVYSMESLQVAKSDVKAASETKGDTPKEDDENEDLVQLSDDDEMMGSNDEDIPLPPPMEKNDKDNANVNETANNDPDLYEPDQPTVGSEDDSEGNEENEGKIRNENNESAGSQTSPTNDMELENPDNTDISLNTATKKSRSKNGDTDEEAEAAESSAQRSDKEEDESNNLLDIQLPESAKKIQQSQRKGVLELYDDSDWEELNMEKPKAENYQLKTPPREGENAQEEEQEPKDDDDENEGESRLPSTEKENNDVEGGKIVDKPEENCARSPDSIEADINPDDKAEDGDEKDKEQDRSYTPCLDEKNDNIDEDDNEGTCTPELAGHTLLTSSLDVTKTATEPESATATDAAGIAGMETELISEDDDSDKRDKRKRSKGEKDREQFKKVSKNQKDRNYRIDRASEDRLRNRRGRSRSRTNDKENQGFSQRRAQRGRFKRRELPRYNVRNVVNQRNFKDRYGRDTSRPRSASRPRRRRSYSRSNSRSRSRSKSRSRSMSSPSKRPRRSFSISPSPPNVRRHSISPRRRMHSPLDRSPVRRSSRTPLRMRSRSNSPVRRLNKHKSKRGPGKRSVSPVKKSRSISRFTPRLSRSRTPPRHKTKRTKDRKKKKTKKRQASPSSQRSRSREHRKDSAPPNKRKRHHTPKDKSPVGDQGWSPSPSPPRNYLHDNVSWTPPLMSPAGVSRLRRNEDYNEFSISSKPPKEKKKRDKKKKKSEKRRGEIVRKEKRRRDAAPNAPSKEVFASGNNILVSVSFNKDGNQPQQTTVVTLPPTREEVLASIRGRSKERQNDQQPKKKKKKDGREKKRKKLDTKPVAIIDLERSPFQVTQEQTDIIVLTDSEGGGNDEENLNVSRESANEMMTQKDHHHTREDSSHRTVNSDKTPPLERLESILEESYENAIQQQGPKTPPEPPGGIKFNLINKNKQKISRNALHDEADLDSDGQQEEERQEERESMVQNANKIGPNTPPESGPCSPDVYDPFDPTKSPSMSPRSPTPPLDMSHDSVPDTEAPSKHSADDLRSEPRQAVAPGVGNSEKSALNPVDLVMALMNNKTNASQDSVHKSNESQYNSSQTVVNLVDENEKPEETSSNLGITVLSNVILSSGKTQHIPSISSPPLSKASSHKPPKLTNILSNLPGIGNRHNGGGMDDNINDIESPYSPGSADYEDLFEPPPDTNGTKRRRGDKRPNKTGEVFESLFGSSSPPPPGAAHVRLPTSTARKHKPTYTSSTRTKHKMIVKVSKLPGTSNDEHVKVYDDLPNSAVELQVKDKFLRKLNRQERVVEEVKMILKPRFNKKQITKDDYKEIMRRAVPKICHSKSGEINPKKIQNLIEAYVKKFRQKHKKLNIPNTGQVSSAVKCAAYLKKL